MAISLHVNPEDMRDTLLGRLMRNKDTDFIGIAISWERDYATLNTIYVLRNMETGEVQECEASRVVVEDTSGPVMSKKKVRKLKF